MIKLQIIIISLCLVSILLAMIAPYIKKLGIGSLPSNILIKKNNFTLFFPITICLVISRIVSLISSFMKK